MESLIDRRKRLLGAAFRQYYDFPFHVARAAGVKVFDAAGKEYLDAYNNVPHVGHCHPKVVAALSGQAALLNTNTRYLFDSIVEYAERLTATMPAGLDACIFTCTGSEANDLAWRLATAWTGSNGAITLEDSYHGNTTSLDALNGQSIKIRGTKPPWVALIDFQKPSKSNDPALMSFARRFDAAIEELRGCGHKPAAFFCDTMFCSNGVYALPSGFLAPAIARLRDAGGLWIADEIQAGLGRLGTNMWGFEALGVQPDIVTLGKPMGNGHPIGAVVTRREIVDRFFRHNQYFNTFGGNSVSSAVGLAVLEVMEEEKLQSNALKVGRHLAAGLQELAARHEIIGEVRGGGLLIGLDLVLDRATMAPASQQARHIINEACRRGVLIGVTGPNKLARNIVKIRPPLVFSAADADRLIDTLDGVLADLPASMAQPP